MLREVFRIPTATPLQLGPLGSWPLFGVGVLLAVWAVVMVVSWGQRLRRLHTDPWNADDWVGLAVSCGLGFAILRAPVLVPGGIPLFGYGLMIFVGVTSACAWAAWRAPRFGFTPDDVWDLAPWLIVPGIVGGRIAFLALHGGPIFQRFSGPELLFALIDLSSGGLVLYGALLLGAAGYFSYCWKRHLKPLAMIDLIMPAVFIGIGFGRVGCLLNGCCYGDTCELPWAVTFPPASAAFEGLARQGYVEMDAARTPPLHPTQIYSAIDGFLLAAFCAIHQRLKSHDGEVLAVALMTYPLTRFLIECLRGDENRMSLTNSQWMSLVLFAVGVGLAVWLSRRRTVPQQASARG